MDADGIPTDTDAMKKPDDVVQKNVVMETTKETTETNAEVTEEEYHKERGLRLTERTELTLTQLPALFVELHRLIDLVYDASTTLRSYNDHFENPGAQHWSKVLFFMSQYMTNAMNSQCGHLHLINKSGPYALENLSAKFAASSSSSSSSSYPPPPTVASIVASTTTTSSSTNHTSGTPERHVVSYREDAWE